MRKNMKKKIFAVLMILTISVNICACRSVDVAESDKDLSDDIETNNNILNQIKDKINSKNEYGNEDKNKYGNEDKDEDKSNVYEWVVEPTIDADDIIVFDNGYLPVKGVKIYKFNEITGEEEESRTLSHDKYAIIKKSGKYGFIRYDGKIMAEPEYEGFGCHSVCGEIYLYNTAFENYYLDKDGEFIHAYTRCGDGFFNIEYISSTNSFSSEYWAEKLSELDIAVPVIEKDDDDGGAFLQGENIGKYGIYYGGKLIADYQYDEYVCCLVNGTDIPDDLSEDMYTFAMRKDDEWYLFDRYGRQILSDGCEKILSNNQYKESQYAKPYIFTEEICAISQDGEMRYIDINGRDIVEKGVFEEVRPVYNGMAWVKQNGKWGVIKFKNMEKYNHEKESEYTE